jgi:hypothetical protein
MLIQDASAIDEGNLKIMYEWAVKHDLQFILEFPGERESEEEIVIEDGLILDADGLPQAGFRPDDLPGQTSLFG